MASHGLLVSRTILNVSLTVEREHPTRSIHKWIFFCWIIASPIIHSPSAKAQGWDHAKVDAPSVIVTPGVPHAWTMEQAHYLLERNRAHDLGLAEKDPGLLDPNDTVGVRVNALRTLVSASAQFDQSVGLKNREAQSRYSRTLGTRNALLAEQQALNLRQTALAFQLAQAQNDLDVLKSATTPDDDKISRKQADVTRLTSETSALNTQAAALNASIPSEPELPSLSVVNPSDAISGSAVGTDSNFDALFKTFATGPGASKLSAKVMLDNYVDFQYEMVAKQLTLLRDLAGPDNRVIFLELPHSIYITSKFHPYPYIGGLWGDHLVQAWWKIETGLIATPLCSNATANGVHRPPTIREISDISENTKLGTSTPSFCPPRTDMKPGFDRIRTFYPPPITLSSSGMNESSDIFARLMSIDRALDNAAVDTTLDGNRLAASTQTPVSNGQPSETKQTEPNNPESIRFDVWRSGWAFIQIPLQHGAAGSPSAPIYTLDLIPRQDSLNVAEATTSTHQMGFAGVFSWLSGIGAKARYERQQQEFSQFTQTQQYATAFGKGDYKFGWTFAPKPGTKQVDAGIRTTYAIVVVPRDTRIVRLKAMGCGYRRRNVPRDPFADDAPREPGDSQYKLDAEDCGSVQSFDIEVPDSDDNFWVSDATYIPVPAGQRTTLTLTGRFGDQVGLLINGSPLQQVPSLTQPGLTPVGYSVPASAGDGTISGVFEVIHNRSAAEDKSSNIVASFVMPATYTGTPKVTIVSASKEELIGDQDFHVSLKASDGSGKVMFYTKPEITRVDADYTTASPNVIFTIVGHDLEDLPTSTLIVQRQAFSSPLGGAPGPNNYAVLVPNVMFHVTVPRNTVFPHASIDYIMPSNPNVVDVSSTWDDNGPSTLGKCSGTALTTPDKKWAVTLNVNGDYFIQTASAKIVDMSDATTTFGGKTNLTVTGTLATKKPSVSLSVAKAVPTSVSCSITYK